MLFSAGLDSAVLLAEAARRDVDGGAADLRQRRTGLGGGGAGGGERLLASGAYGPRVLPLVPLSVDMRDVYPPGHWAVRGEAPASDTPDEDVYLEGRNVVLLSKAAVYMARAGISRVLIGPLAGNPFPDATAGVLRRDGARALDRPGGADRDRGAIRRRSTRRTSIALGRSLGVPLELTLSCMQPRNGVHCGRCSKCRERRDGFREAGVEDPTTYAV